jgi:hypothetical protein
MQPKSLQICSRTPAYGASLTPRGDRIISLTGGITLFAFATQITTSINGQSALARNQPRKLHPGGVAPAAAVGWRTGQNAQSAMQDQITQYSSAIHRLIHLIIGPISVGTKLISPLNPKSIILPRRMYLGSLSQEVVEQITRQIPLGSNDKRRNLCSFRNLPSTSTASTIFLP